MEAVRTCVGCRERASRTALVRVAVQNGEIVFDERAVLPGRGAWVHPVQECLDVALRRRGFVRALRVAPETGFPAAANAQTIEKYFQRNKG